MVANMKNLKILKAPSNALQEGFKFAGQSNSVVAQKVFSNLRCVTDFKSPTPPDSSQTVSGTCNSIAKIPVKYDPAIGLFSILFPEEK